MSLFFRASGSFLLIALFCLSCKAPPPPSWSAKTIYEIDSKIQQVAYGALWEAGIPQIALVTADGRCVVLWQDERGDWLNQLVHHAPSGLSAVAIGDADPSVPGNDLVVGTGGGQVLVISRITDKDIGVRLIYQAEAPIGDLAVHDLMTTSPGEETMVLSEDGKVAVLWPVPEKFERGFLSQIVFQDLDRLRDVLVGPYGPQQQIGAVVVGSSGHVTRLHSVGNAWRVVSLYQNPEPLARIAGGDIDPSSRARELIIADDAGLITLLHQSAGEYIPQAIRKEKKALRGLVVGEFDPAVLGQEFAVFGYDMEVAVFSRKTPEYERIVRHKDSDRGHWLIACRRKPEDSRDSLISVGYSGKVTLIEYR